MKQVQVRVSVLDRKGLVGWIFGPVEDRLYAYMVAIKNTGDEPVGSHGSTASGTPSDIDSVEFAWTFPSKQVNLRQFPFPAQLAPGETHFFPWVEHKILSSGFSLLTARLRRLGRGLDLHVTNESGQTLPLSDSIEEAPSVPGYRASGYVAELPYALASFRASSRTEMLQLILITIATTALVANVILGILNYVR